MRIRSHFSLPVTTIMAGRIKLFSTFQKLHESMSLKATSPKYLINPKNIFLSISTVQLFITSSAYFFFGAKTTDEHAISFFISITILSVVINVSTIALKYTDEILTLIGKYEQFIEKS